MADTNETTNVWLGRIALGLLAVLSLACLGSGGTFYGWIVADYLQDDSPFTGLQMIAWALGLMAAGVICIGLLLAGLLFRFLRWPLASLGLAVFSIAFIIATYLVFSDTGNGGNSIEVVLLQGVCILSLFIVPLPPFLHWLRAKPSAAPRSETGS